MTRVVGKFGLVVAAALALALVPVSSWGQSKPPAGATGKAGSTGKSGSTGSTAQPSAAEVLKKADQMRTEAGRRAAAQADQKAAAEAAAKSGKAGEPITNTAPKTSGFIVEKGDPFAIPIKSAPASPAAQDLPPGQAGLVVAQAELQGIVKTPSGNVALVHGPNNRTYFLKVNDKVYNAHVTKVGADSISFEETTVDPLGKMSKREITKSMPSDPKKP